MRPANDRIQRRTQLMGDGGEKSILQLARPFGGGTRGSFPVERVDARDQRILKAPVRGLERKSTPFFTADAHNRRQPEEGGERKDESFDAVHENRSSPAHEHRKIHSPTRACQPLATQCSRTAMPVKRISQLLARSMVQQPSTTLFSGTYVARWAATAMRRTNERPKEHSKPI
jgi:hypothetical protein